MYIRKEEELKCAYNKEETDFLFFIFFFCGEEEETKTQ